MDEVYRDIYADLYNYDYGKLHLRWEILEEGRWYPYRDNLRLSIESSESTLMEKQNIKLRADAKYLLLVNFWQMIVIPIQMARKSEIKNIQDIVSNDISVLLEEASRNCKSGDEISGHAIINALSRSWKNLKVSNAKLWES